MYLGGTKRDQWHKIGKEAFYKRDDLDVTEKLLKCFLTKGGELNDKSLI